MKPIEQAIVAWYLRQQTNKGLTESLLKFVRRTLKNPAIKSTSVFYFKRKLEKDPGFKDANGASFRAYARYGNKPAILMRLKSINVNGFGHIWTL